MIKIREKISVNEIIELNKNGLSYREIGDMFGVSKQAIHSLVKRYLNGSLYLKLHESVCNSLNENFSESNITLKQYSESLGISYGVIRKILSGESKSIKYTNAKKISKFLNIPLSQVIHESNLNTYKRNIEHSATYKEVASQVIIKRLNVKTNLSGSDGFVSVSKNTADLIKAYRITNKLSCAQLAERIGISTSRISQIENYTTLGVRYSTLVQISMALNISLEKLLYPDDTIGIDINLVNFRVKLNTSTMEKIRIARKKNKLSQKELGEKCGASQEIISRIELGYLKSIEKNIFNKICTILNLNTYDLINEM